MKNSIYFIRRLIQYNAAKIISNEVLTKLYFYYILKYKLNLDNPKTFNEKLCWLKLNEYKNNKDITDCSDKYLVREYIKKCGLEKYLNELYFYTNRVDDIKWNTLPKNFVLKCNHGSAYNIICDDINNFNIISAKKVLKKWMKEDFSLFNIEPQYKKIKRKIICEKYLGKNIYDYKFFCFNGIPRFYYISKDLDNLEKGKISFFDLQGNRIPVRRKAYKELDKNFNTNDIQEMLNIVNVLAKKFKFVRVDLFLVNKNIYFSELTFLPSGGMMELYPLKYDYIWGSYLELNNG